MQPPSPRRNDPSPAPEQPSLPAAADAAADAAAAAVAAAAADAAAAAADAAVDAAAAAADAAAAAAVDSHEMPSTSAELGEVNGLHGGCFTTLRVMYQTLIATAGKSRAIAKRKALETINTCASKYMHEEDFAVGKLCF